MGGKPFDIGHRTISHFSLLSVASAVNQWKMVLILITLNAIQGRKENPFVIGHWTSVICHLREYFVFVRAISWIVYWITTYSHPRNHTKPTASNDK